MGSTRFSEIPTSGVSLNTQLGRVSPSAGLSWKFGLETSRQNQAFLKDRNTVSDLAWISDPKLRPDTAESEALDPPADLDL